MSQPRRLSVLHVCQPTDGGVAQYVAALTTDQSARGWITAVACPDSGRLAEDLANRDVTWLHWPARRSPSRAVAAEAFSLVRLVSERKPDVVHLHSSKAGLTGRLVIRGRLPTLFQPHGWSWLAVEGVAATAAMRWERAATRWTDLLVCVGVGELEEGRSRGMRGQFALVRNGVDLNRFRPAWDARAARAGLGMKPDVPLAVCVGRVTRQKGQDILLAAWPRVIDHLPGAKLCLVGDGDLLPVLRSQAAIGVQFTVTDDVRPWYAAADVVVLPSRWEGLSLSLLEALASGRPVVAAQVSGLADALPSDAGELVPPEDPQALAAAILRRLKDPNLVIAESHAAVRAATQFDVRHTFDRLAKITETVATVNRQSLPPG
jgi:glycosyltransferase involved in cell wall biosynthesis